MPLVAWLVYIYIYMCLWNSTSHPYHDKHGTRFRRRCAYCSIRHTAHTVPSVEERLQRRWDPCSFDTLHDLDSCRHGAHWGWQADGSHMITRSSEVVFVWSHHSGRTTTTHRSIPTILFPSSGPIYWSFRTLTAFLRHLQGVCSDPCSAERRQTKNNNDLTVPIHCHPECADQK